VIPSQFGAGYASIPAGYRFGIALANDAQHNVNGVTLLASDQNGTPLFEPKWVAMSTLVDQQGKPVTPAGLGPIADIDFVIAGYANGADTTLTSGAGSITYRAGSPLTVLNTFPPCMAGVNTEESSNVTYGELDSAPSTQIVQPFIVRDFARPSPVRGVNRTTPARLHADAEPA
jgi:hypothetical protein